MRLCLSVLLILGFAVPAAAQSVDFSLTDPDAIAAECGGTAADGALLFETCAGCHAVKAEDATANLVGPHLESLFGRQVASLDGYAYSPGLRLKGASGEIWERDALHAFLTTPTASPSHPVVVDEQSRRDILTYLRTATLPTPPAPGELIVPEEVLAIAGDRAYGEYLASECAGCHQAGSANIPALQGYDRTYFITALHEYRARSRENETMRTLTARLSNEEIAALAAYYTEE